MTAAVAHPGRDALGTVWFLVSRAGHLDCGRWTFEDGERLRCACGAVLYVYRRPVDTAGSGAPAPAGTSSPHGREERMLPAETAQLVALVAAMCPSMHLEDTTTDAWQLLLADLDVADVRAAVTRLGMRQPRIAASDIRAEVRTIREERLARNPLPLPDSDPDDPRRYRAELLELVTAIASGRRVRPTPATPGGPPARPTGSKRDPRVRSLRVPCPWCGAAAGRPCTVPRLGIPLRRAPAHQARLLAAGLAEPGPGAASPPGTGHHRYEAARRTRTGTGEEPPVAREENRHGR
ncbi:zinc finger domain-containing protein [Streptomyces sp. bgisy082]|uniref:zinc finger domain-containing protein n=1 Tax=Streptomyces sp. bgisy082 TaxID=3413776 RepID=UPI003D7321BA